MWGSLLGAAAQLGTYGSLITWYQRVENFLIWVIGISLTVFIIERIWTHSKIRKVQSTLNQVLQNQEVSTNQDKSEKNYKEICNQLQEIKKQLKSLKRPRIKRQPLKKNPNPSTVVNPSSPANPRAQTQVREQNRFNDAEKMQTACTNQRLQFDKKKIS